MCGSMVNIQSPVTEIRRGKKIEERKIENTGQKYSGLPLLVDTPSSPGELGVSTSMKLSMPTRCAPTCDACAKITEGIHDLLLLTATPPNAAAAYF